MEDDCKLDSVKNLSLRNFAEGFIGLER